MDKPSGMTSFQMVKLIKRKLKAKKVGHTGTLDPLATGLLPICLGNATKIVQFIMDGSKKYHGTMVLGTATDTYDSHGNVVSTAPVPSDLTIDDLQELANHFVGRIKQVPPPFSAVKYKGRPLYKFARQGISIAKEPRTVEILSFEIMAFNAPVLEFRVHCSKGTYIRALAHELGKLVGCGAHLTALRRTHSGSLSLRHAITVEELDRLIADGSIGRSIIPKETALAHIPAMEIDPTTARAIRCGHPTWREKVAALISKGRITGDGMGGPFLRLVTTLDDGAELVAIINRPANGTRGRDWIKTVKVWA